jgi:hypothetical protein
MKQGKNRSVCNVFFRNGFILPSGILQQQQPFERCKFPEEHFCSLYNFNNMKNKILALTAAALLASAIAFGFTQSSGSSCCDKESATCCPAPDQCPVPCCETGSTCQ